MKVSTVVAAASEIVLALLAPPRCAGCDAPVRMRVVFCATCAATLERATIDPRALTSAAYVYGGAIATAITRFKYERRAELARPLAHVLLHATRALEAPDVVVPVALHPSRLAERGYNQASLLARPVATDLDVHFSPLALERTRDTPRQAALDRTARAANVAGAFRVRRPDAIRDRRVLLVDDVATTGATLAACAAALRAAGATDVRAAVVARAELQ